ncbi:uncharacterized membrane protein HdeD (DUF308 family) [Nocardioides thalensis]|uniref:Uncharacterized membrane protein HdeD (DUF308 family) n=1 Tax=Nocardioides thalensis TaxID=1914755 RepID=A0A853C6C2_9ACTN|nr:hypothetical protein [Nocardioides thalensis]NYJ02232.1 uncharacterized membrane protein HdeD (DUF308 family) [Nocardioides thalensis]
MATSALAARPTSSSWRPGFWMGLLAGIVPALAGFVVDVMLLANIDTGIGFLLTAVGAGCFAGVILLAYPSLRLFAVGLLAGAFLCFVGVAGYLALVFSSITAAAAT